MQIYYEKREYKLVNKHKNSYIEMFKGGIFVLGKYLENNCTKLGGVVVSDLQFSHEVYGEKFYIFDMEVERLSGMSDIIKTIISERLIDVNNFNVGKVIYVEGQFRSYNQYTDGKSKLILSVFVKDIETENLPENVKTINETVLNGFLCKKPIYRKTPLGREISDILVAVNRTYNKSDYIPCILWGRNAKFSESMEVGTNVKVTGRIQSRTYEKKYPDGTSEKKVAYEISVSKFELYKENTENVESEPIVE